MSRKRFHGLKKAKIRASWNKYNLYNLSRWKAPFATSQTFYQQKWSSKSVTRAYHGEMIREKQWQRMFTSKLDAVIPMDHRYLAEHDGSELAAGRGSGVEVKPNGSNVRRGPLPVPYMNMTYAPVERRLDMAIFRALFASSARQARQLVVHGKVKVNGHRMPYPGYLLNPGDMYQVDIDSVMYSTGATKPPEQRREGRAVLRRQRAMNANREKFRAVGIAKRKAKLAQAAAEGKEIRSKRKRKPDLHDAPTERNTIKEELQVVVDQIQKVLQRLKDRGHWRLGKRKTALRWKRKGKSIPRRRLLNFMRTVNDTIRQTFRISVQELDQKRTNLTTQWLKMEADLPRNARESERTMAIDKERGDLATKRKMIEEEVATGIAKISLKDLPKERRKQEKEMIRSLSEFREKQVKVLEEGSAEFREALARARENPIDSSKPYATPWEPRPYMSAFAFIPRYLEVNHTICSAVYLRHPVARPGLAEVPSPFPTENQQLAFNWYLRRR